MKFNTQNAKIESITDKTLVVGIDVGSEMHYARAFTNRGIELSEKPFPFSNNEAGFLEFYGWMEELKQKNGMNSVATGMEPTGHYWFNLGAFLQDRGIRPLHVNPYHVKQSKELDDNNPTKNDRKDPKVIAGLVNEGRYSYPYIPKDVYAEVRCLSNQRLQAQESLIRAKNRLARWFSVYFPEYKEVYTAPDAISGILVLRKAPLPADIVKLGVDGINQIWREAKLRGSGLKRAKTLVSAAEHSIGSREAQESARIELGYLLDDIERYKNRVDKLIEILDQKLAEIPYVDKLLAVPGIGKRTVCGFIAEVGDIGRFDSPKQLQKLAGLSIVESSSGKHKGETHISYRGRKRLRYVLYEAALSVVARVPEFRTLHDYYTHRKQNPLKKMQSLIAISCKLIRLFYAILTKGIDYDGTKMLSDIRRPGGQPQAA